MNKQEIMQYFRKLACEEEIAEIDLWQAGNYDAAYHAAGRKHAYRHARDFIRENLECNEK